MPTNAKEVSRAKKKKKRGSESERERKNPAPITTIASDSAAH